MALLLASIPFVQGSHAENYTSWELPEGTLARLDKGNIYEVAYSPDGTRLAVSSSSGIWLYDTSTGAEVVLLQGHAGVVYSVSFSPDGQILASGSWDMTVRLWDVANGEEQAVLEGHTDRVPSVSFSSDGQILASGSWDQTVRLWDVASGEEKAVLEGHTGWVWSVSFSSDGQILASGSGDQTIRLWDVASGQAQHSSGFSKVVLAGHADWVSSVSFSPDGQILVSGSGDQTIRLWDVSPYVAPSAAKAQQPVLLPNYPNPFNSSTQIAYRLAAPGFVRLTIYNALGQSVRTLVDQVQIPGEYQVAWDARDQRGTLVASGVYLMRLQYPSGRQTRRLLCLK